MDKSTENYIIDDQNAGLFRVNRRAFTDPECLQEERRRVFDKCWIYVGHESEVIHAHGHPARRQVEAVSSLGVRGGFPVARANRRPERRTQRVRHHPVEHRRALRAGGVDERSRKTEEDQEPHHGHGGL